MRIVNRQKFMELPSGTLYRKFIKPYSFDDVKVKYDSLKSADNSQYSDFVCMPLGDVEFDCTGQYFERLDDMMYQGISYPLDLDCAGRDGCFEQDAMFLVYERDDLIKLRDFIAALVDA